MKRKTLPILAILIFVLTMFPIISVADNAPFTLVVPKNLTSELKLDDNGIPYFELRLDIPSSVQDLNTNLLENPEYFEGKQCDAIEIEFEYKYGNYDWNEGPSLFWNTSDSVDAFIQRGGYWEYNPFDSGGFDNIDIKSEVYSFRARFHAVWGHVDDWMDKDIYSDYSNITTVGNPAFYENASNWAKPELENANEAGLIPDILKGADLTKPITREEFAELAVLLYEKVTEKVSEPVSPNPFNDTINPQILKAYKLEIVKGTSNTTFEPKTLINREQCAVMLFRTIKAIKPDDNYSISGAKDFPDQKYISSWAVDATKYMSKIGIIKGDSKGNFMPKAETTAQEAVGYGMATREAAILMTVRTFEKIN